ncbi:MAG: T9SS type A sorting domain-containing protein, partial [Candidatus Delongbacteria bacterium]
PLYGTLYFDDIHLYDSTVGIEQSVDPENYVLEQNYPNPFNPSTVIKFNIEKTAMVKLDIFDINGQLVNTLVNRNMNSGAHSVNWTAKDRNGNDLSSGIYFYRLSLDGKAAATKNMILIK